MPQRMRLGPTSGGSIDTVRALVQLDQTDFQDLELSAETRKAILRATNDGVLVDAQGGDVTLESATGDVLPGSSNPALGTSATPWPSVSTDEATISESISRTIADGVAADNPTTVENSAGRDLRIDHFSGEVSTTAVEMLNAGFGNNLHFAIVTGWESGSSSNRFVETVMNGTVQNTESVGTAASRTYDTANGNLRLTMGAATYNIVARGYSHQ